MATKWGSPDDLGLSLFKAEVKLEVVNRYRRGDFSKVETFALEAMETLLESHDLVTRAMIRKAIARRESIDKQKGWSQIMVNMVAAGIVALIKVEGITHHYRLNDDSFKPA